MLIIGAGVRQDVNIIPNFRSKKWAMYIQLAQ